VNQKEYIIFCDESEKTGKYYSNFYGGLIVGAAHYQKITERLNKEKGKLNFYGEVKWDKVSENYLAKYITFVQRFFREIRGGRLRIRIMFRHNVHDPCGLTEDHISNQYFILYYQFIKHAFGLQHVEPRSGGTKVRLYFDQFPDTSEKAEQFKGFLLGLNRNRGFLQAKLIVAPENIAEVRSHDHVLLQCLDIVLGAMAFRLNDKHKEKPAGQRIRGKKTRAKEALYKVILAEIRKITPGFNVGITTGTNGNTRERWTRPYLHWQFVPKEHNYKPEAAKERGSKKINPTRPT
jgi:hypothetical protein